MPPSPRGNLGFAFGWYKNQIKIYLWATMANSGFAWLKGGGAATPEEGAQQPIKLRNFAENCLRMKEFGLRGGVCLAPPLVSAIHV